jgi:short-subunit dehydrogenase
MRVFITGASSGLGEALAQEYSQRFRGAGLIIGLVARREAELARVAAQLAGATVECYALDVTDRVALVSAKHGVPEVVIANAGISAGTTTGQANDAAVFERIIRTNVIAMFDTFAPFVDAMSAQKHGTLVGVASVAGIRGLPGAGGYSASKAAAISYLESLRVELRGSGVAVVTIAPGYIRSPMTASNQYPMPFLMDADQFARSAVDAIAARRAFVVIPWPMAIVARALRLLPPLVYDALFARAPRKARL